MRDIYEILDEMASQGEYVTLTDVVSRYYGKALETSYKTSENNMLKQWLNRHHADIDYLNGRDLGGGFRYKVGSEYLYKAEQEQKLFCKMDADARNMFYTGGLQMLLDGKTSFSHVIDLECVTGLQNLCLVKVLAKCLGKWPISFDYMQGYENIKNFTMHPHYLKEYNSRWFLFGYVFEESGFPKIYNFALDRIIYRKEGDIQKHQMVKCERAPRNFYQEYFKDIVGVSRSEGGIVQTITIRTKDFIVHNLIRTKPIHASQKETIPFDKENLVGEFTIQVIPNIELQTRLLSYGPGLYLTSGGKVQQDMRNAINKMKALYDSE